MVRSLSKFHQWSFQERTMEGRVNFFGFHEIIIFVVKFQNTIWLVVWNMAFMTFHILGMSSSQLTLTPSFFRGLGLPAIFGYLHVHGSVMVILNVFWWHIT